MSGHSKWKTIQHRKGAADAKRGQIFSRLSKELTIVARTGGGNPEMNPALRTLINKARAANMPMDNVERAIKKGTGEIAGEQLEEFVYEGYAGGGIAVIVKVLTDNRNRAASEIRHIFTRFGRSLETPGSVIRNFKRKGQIYVSLETVEEDKLMSIVLEAGAEDMQVDDDVYEILTEPSDFQAVADALEAAGIKTVSAEISMVPESYMTVTDKSVASHAMKFIDALEDNDDVQDVYSNLDVDAKLLAELESEEN